VTALIDDDSGRPSVDANLQIDAEVEDNPLVGGDPTGRRAPERKYERLTGGLTSLAEYAGGPVVVNFFGSWCVPCRDETPAFQSVHEELGDQVTFVGFAVQDSTKAAAEFAERYGVTYDIGRDPSGAMLEAFEGVRMPSTFLVSPDGRIVAKHGGPLTADELRDLIAEHLDVRPA
jgi:thiol-disulfide isomerase/thioredoxin